MAFLAPLLLSFAPDIISTFQGIFTDEEDEDFDEYYADEDQNEDDGGWFDWF